VVRPIFEFIAVVVGVVTQQRRPNLMVTRQVFQLVAATIRVLIWRRGPRSPHLRVVRPIFEFIAVVVGVVTQQRRPNLLVTRQIFQLVAAVIRVLIWGRGRRNSNLSRPQSFPSHVLCLDQVSCRCERLPDGQSYMRFGMGDESVNSFLTTSLIQSSGPEILNRLGRNHGGTVSLLWWCYRRCLSIVGHGALLVLIVAGRNICITSGYTTIVYASPMPESCCVVAEEAL